MTIEMKIKIVYDNLAWGMIWDSSLFQHFYQIIRQHVISFVNLYFGGMGGDLSRE